MFHEVLIGFEQRTFDIRVALDPPSHHLWAFKISVSIVLLSKEFRGHGNHEPLELTGTAGPNYFKS